MSDSTPIGCATPGALVTRVYDIDSLTPTPLSFEERNSAVPYSEVSDDDNPFFVAEDDDDPFPYYGQIEEVVEFVRQNVCPEYWKANGEVVGKGHDELVVTASPGVQWEVKRLVDGMLRHNAECERRRIARYGR